MRSIERRIFTVEQRVNSENDADRLTDEELAAQIVDQMEEWCRAGLTLEQVADGLMGLGYDEEARTIPDEFEWDADSQTIRRLPHGMRLGSSSTDVGRRT